MCESRMKLCLEHNLRLERERANSPIDYHFCCRLCSLWPSGSLSISEGAVEIRNAARLFFLKSKSRPCSLQTSSVLSGFWNRSDYSDKTLASYFTGDIWIGIHHHPSACSEFLSGTLVHNPPSFILLRLPPHLPSYCWIIRHCLRSAEEDQCSIIANTQSKALWCESLSDLYTSCRKEIYTLHKLHLVSTGQGEARGSTKLLITLQSL